MRSALRLAGAAMLLAASCSSRRPAAPVPESAATDARPTSPVGAAPSEADPNATRVLHQVLAERGVPAAVVVLELAERPKLVALAGHHGADPARQSLRPGSTVKPLVAWIAAEAGVLRPDDAIMCPGTSEGSLRCFSNHGSLELGPAITTSCNGFFYELGARLGLDGLGRGFDSLGLTRKSGLADGEASGFVATPALAKERSEDERRWASVVASGHGPLEVTLLELAVAYALLTRRLADASSGVPDELRTTLRESLLAVVADDHGTGRAAAVPGLSIAGKTGTAEAEPFGEPVETAGPENGWFVGYAPADNPATLVAAVVLGRGSGGTTAAPLVGEVFRRLKAGVGRGAR